MRGAFELSIIKGNHTKYDLIDQGPSTLLRIAFQLQVSWKKPFSTHLVISFLPFFPTAALVLFFSISFFVKIIDLISFKRIFVIKVEMKIVFEVLLLCLLPLQQSRHKKVLRFEISGSDLPY